MLLVHLSICLSIYLSIYLFIYLSIYLWNLCSATSGQLLRGAPSPEPGESKSFMELVK